MSAIETMAVPAPTRLKVSRYRSLRGKSVSETSSIVDRALSNAWDAPPMSQPPAKTSKFAKRRSKSFAAAPAPAPPAFDICAPAIVPPVPPLPVSVRSRFERPFGSAREDGSNASWISLVNPPSSTISTLTLSPPPAEDSTGLAGAGTCMVATPKTDTPQLDCEHAELWEDENSCYKEEKEATLWAETVARLEAENDRILREQRLKNLARLQSQLVPKGDGGAASNPQRPQAPPSPSPLRSLKLKSPVLDKVAFLRGRRSNAAILMPTSSVYTSIDLSRVNSLEPTLSPRYFVEPAENRIITAIDPPVAASNNSFETTATVRCRGKHMALAVDISTTTIDILTSCSAALPKPIDTSSSMVIEVYNSLGLERRVRRYERIRDIMNSWDRDTQNSLIVLPDVFESDRDLGLASVPQTHKPPQGFVLPLYHSSRPGKWNKRFITLLEGGQVFSSKKPTDKDLIGLCHISDYDIYTPTEARLKKHLKPPKKYCYAIKSQQKTTVLTNTDNFVHFFCTEEADIARQFHAAVHMWRSWYLANKLLEWKKRQEADPAPQIVTKQHKSRKSVSHVKFNGHKLRVSVDEAPYAIGEFSPLVDMKRFDKPLVEFGNDWELDMTRHSSMLLAKNKDKKAAVAAIAVEKETPFAANGLLGDAYRKRKQEAQKAEEAETIVEGPFTEGPNLLNGGVSAATKTKPEVPSESAMPQPASWFPSALEHTTRARDQTPARPSTSSGAMSSHERDQQRRSGPGPNARGRPLVDLAQQYHELPQWARDRSGRGVDVPEGLLMINYATNANAGPNGKFLAVAKDVPRQEGDGASAPRQWPRTSDGQRLAPSQSQSIGARSASGSHAVSHSRRPPVPPLPASLLRAHSHEDAMSSKVPEKFPMPQPPTGGHTRRPSTSSGESRGRHRDSDPKRRARREPPQMMTWQSSRMRSASVWR